MARIAFILLCHRDADAIIRQARQLTAAGDCLTVHFDGRAKASEYAKLHAALGQDPNIALVRRRVRCGWGEWSLVRATLRAATLAMHRFPNATHFYMISGDCMPIKTAAQIQTYLDENDADFIECVDYFDGNWIKTGMKEERLIYRHFFNERSQARLFYTSMKAQERLKLRRKPPGDLRMRIGSQWWCLRRKTLTAVLNFAHKRRDVTRFFATTWIPDETFFQTIVPHLVPEPEVRSRPLTFLLFSDYGMPVCFYNDHHDMLLGQEQLFARKISPEARELKDRLASLFVQKDVPLPSSGDGRALFHFLAGRGRVGRRFAPRMWQAGATLGRERELMIVICKKWHVAKRLLDRIRQHTNVPALDYLFNEADAPLPDLGGLETDLNKRNRHRRAVMRLLFDHFETDRMIICSDPVEFELLRDFAADRCVTRFLEIDCTFSDEDLAGHATRIGLAREDNDTETLGPLLTTLRNDITFETERIRDAALPNYSRIHENTHPDDAAQALAGFLTVPLETARDITPTPTLFTD
ncbi:DUF5928 domain-containing protein [uncultured Roseobacter sp.]|uniref:DUF5928 domain-containing protein n=1 Tax=uncultured Roseobacter sp. TaxID=114847 RepID=UPI002624F520|nr:DUF5928 domain-containing protein [uncultured Roseobacter sp.]